MDKMLYSRDGAEIESQAPHPSWIYWLSVLLICGFVICKPVHSPKFICNSKPILGAFSQVFNGPVQSGKRFESLDKHVPSWGQTKQCSAFLFPLIAVNKHPLHGVLSAGFSNFGALGWVFMKAPKHCAEVLTRLVFLSAKWLWCALC